MKGTLDWDAPEDDIDIEEPEEPQKKIRVHVPNEDFDLDEDFEKYLTMSFEEKRRECIKWFQKTFKDSMAFDICMLTKEERSRMTEDETYIMCTRAIRGRLFAHNMRVLGMVENQEFSMDDRDQTKNIIDALDRKNKMIFDGLNDGNEENTINIRFFNMSKKDFEEDENCEIFIGKNSNGTIDVGDKSAEDIARDKAIELVKKEKEEKESEGEKSGS